MKPIFRTKGCTALVTGASAGLGAEFACQLASDASRLVLVARRKDRLDTLADAIMRRFPALRVDSFVADLSLDTERIRLHSWVVREEIPLNLLVNNAGLGDLGPFDNATWGRLSKILEVNVTALTHLTHLLLPMLCANKPSAIVNVSSVASFYPLPDMAVYAASKAYVTSFSEALRIELLREHVYVTTVCPGPVPTEFFEVASRPGVKTQAKDRTHHSLCATPELVVTKAIQGLERGKLEVIPNRLLALVVHGSRLLPSSLIRKLIQLRRR